MCSALRYEKLVLVEDYSASFSGAAFFAAFFVAVFFAAVFLVAVFLVAVFLVAAFFVAFFAGAVVGVAFASFSTFAAGLTVGLSFSFSLLLLRYFFLRVLFSTLLYCLPIIGFNV